MSTTTLNHQLEARIRQELPSLTAEQAAELAHIVATLVQTFQPEVVYVFGSQARGDATEDSDIDLMVIVTSSDEPSYRRAQKAYCAVGSHTIPAEILVWTHEEFDQRRPNPATLPGTIVREGKILYATAIPG